MIRNYFTSAIRNFLRHKSFTLLNIIGLSLGIAASLLILQYVKYERSFDKFHSNAEDIYRIQYNGYQGGKLRFECAAAVPAAGPALKNNFSEVKQFARLYPVSGIVSYQSPDRGVISFREEKMQIADPGIFEVFDFDLVKGNESDALVGPNKAVISERAAKKYFGEEDPIGKNIDWDGTNKFEITGVMKNVPQNSHIKFDILFSYQTLNAQTKNESETNWGWYDFNTYVLLKPGTDVNELQGRWNAFLEKNRGEEWTKNNNRQEFILQPMLAIHLYANLLQESQPEERGDGDSVYALSIIALFILAIAWVNYINLATAKSFERANEVGVRKVMGAQKEQLVRQFLAESFLVNLFAALIAILLVRIAWPSFSNLSGRIIPLDYMMQADFWLLVSLLFLAGSVLSGFYPAIILSSFKPISVLKGKSMGTSQSGVLRKGLVVFQFVAYVVLIIGSIVVYQQLSFMKNQNLGVNINQTLVLKGPSAIDSTYRKNLESFRTEALRIPGIKSMTASTNVPGDEIFWASGIRRINAGPENSISGYSVGIDHEYVPAFGLQIIAGRNFDLDHPNERKSVMLNRAMIHSLEFKDPESAIGEKVRHGGDTLEIVGVLEDYHQMSLKTMVSPLVFRFISASSFFAFKIESENSQQLLSTLDGPWKTFFPGNPIDYFFLDQFFNRQYESDLQFGRVFSLFTVLAIFIACLGLFGLASFMTIQRTKEIGIRKVLGSSSVSIVLLLSKGFIQLVLVANIIAWPLAWWGMNLWLESFPYRISVNPLLFALAGFGVVFIAFVSVGFQTLKAARVDPAKTLKYE
ncbi:MAG: FtsX-like permease family protein [Cyclobacteriaceae bacterium]|nr:FtsX-like permease family protein [Cyclobacteriaceae bacterium]